MQSLTPEREAEIREVGRQWPNNHWPVPILLAEIDRLRAANLTLAADSCDTEAAIFAACASAGVVRQTSPEFNEPVEDMVERMAIELATCRAALKPFADYADILDENRHPDNMQISYYHHPCRLQVGDCRRARTAYASAPPPEAAT